MPKRNAALTTIALIIVLVFLVAVTPEPITPNTARLTWITQPETTYINVWNTTLNELVQANAVTGGVTNTLTLHALEGWVFQIQEYKLVNGRLELVLFFNADPVPHVDFPTATPTIEQTATPLPSVTPTPTPSQIKPRNFLVIIMR